MFELPKKSAEFTPYEPLVGEYRIRLDVNESFIEVDRGLVSEAASRVKFNRYPDPYAVGIIGAFANLFGVNPAYVVAGNGSDELIGVIAASLLEKGDSVLTLPPDFSMYGFYSRLYELNVTELAKPAMAADIDAVIDCVKANNIKAVMFSNPCNPTSLGIEKCGVRRLIEETGALVVLDEAYMDFWDEAQSFVKEAANYPNLIVLRTCSKSVALAGIRLGFAVAGEKITRVLKAAKSPYNVNSVTQAIGEAVLSDTDKYRANVAAVKKSAAELYDALNKLAVFEKIYDTKTNFVFAETKKAREIYEYLLGKGIAVRCFGGHLRITAGTDEENAELVKQLAVFANP